MREDIILEGLLPFSLAVRCTFSMCSYERAKVTGVNKSWGTIERCIKTFARQIARGNESRR